MITGIGDGQGSLAGFDSWGREEWDTTERLNWTELITIVIYNLFNFSWSWSPPIILIFTAFPTIFAILNLNNYVQKYLIISFGYIKCVN